MKNLILTLSIFLIFFQLKINAQCSISGVSITSVLVDPNFAGNGFDTDNDGSADHDDEFIEICNNSGVTVDIGGWELGDMNGYPFTFPGGTMLAAGDCAVVVTDWDGVQPLPAMIFDIDQDGDGFLGNNGDRIRLTNGTNTCTVAYGDKDCVGVSDCEDWGDDQDTCPLLASGVNCLYIPGPLAAALPVTLVSFEAKPTNNKSVTLIWQTASEENNDYFSIEHSTDGISFREIATQTGNGTTELVQNYTFLHKEVENGLHYYRLKQVDFDGKFEYTNIVTAKISHSNDDIFLTPNPTSNVILIQTKTPFERDADFQILNMQGQVVLSSVLQEGVTNVELNIADFPFGIYYLQLFVDNDVMMKKIIKQ